MSPHHQSLKFISRYLSSFSFLVIFAFGSDWPTLIAVVVNDHAFLLNAHLDAVEPKSETVNANFSANFEGRKGRAVTESERKRIPDSCSREAELRHDRHFLFLFKVGMRKVVIRTRTRRPRKDIDMNKFSQVLRGSASDSDDLIAETRYFVFKSLFYGEPVQWLEKRIGVFCSMRFKEEFGAQVCTCRSEGIAV